MPKTKVPEHQVRQVLDAIENDQSIDVPDIAPEKFLRSPTPTTYRLAAGWTDPETGEWVREFTVRELNGYDEEALAKITSNGKRYQELMRRGLVAVGKTRNSEDVIDTLQAGDWETVLLAVRSVTFGREVNLWWTCASCTTRFEFTADLDSIAEYTYDGPEDESFSVEVQGVRYEVDMPLGDTQKKMLDAAAGDITIAEQNTLMLEGCVTRIDGGPSLGRESVLRMGQAARRAILAKINELRPGPRLLEVTTKCPSCGAVNATPLSIAALFQF